MTIAKRLDNFLRRTFSKRKLCYIYFYYEEKGVDLKRPVVKMQPYLAWVHVNEHVKNLAPIFETKVAKGRSIKIKEVRIIPIPYVEVI